MCLDFNSQATYNFSSIHCSSLYFSTIGATRARTQKNPILLPCYLQQSLEINQPISISHILANPYSILLQCVLKHFINHNLTSY